MHLNQHSISEPNLVLPDALTRFVWQEIRGRRAVRVALGDVSGKGLELLEDLL